MTRPHALTLADPPLPATDGPRTDARPGDAAPAARIDALFRACAADTAHAVARRLRCDVGEVEDGCQQAWSILARRPDVLDGPNPRAWLVSVAYHACLAERRRPPLRLTGAERLDGRDGPEAAVEAREALRSVAALRPVRRRVFERHLAGLTYAEIMAELGLTYTNVNRQMRDARAELRRAA